MNDDNKRSEMDELIQVMNYIAKELKCIEIELKNIGRAIGRIR